jgi:putative transposase
MHRHLRRLDRVWLEPAIFFVTTCTRNRRAILASERVAGILIEEWRSAPQRYGWHVGRYVIMPDHVHSFCAPDVNAASLSQFIGGWKRWTSRRISNLPRTASAATGPIWQREFFDHVLRSEEGYDQKWNYVRDNPVRAGFVLNASEWSFAGEIDELRL